MEDEKMTNEILTKEQTIKYAKQTMRCITCKHLMNEEDSYGNPQNICGFKYGTNIDTYNSRYWIYISNQENFGCILWEPKE